MAIFRKFSHNGPIVGQSLVSILRSQEIPFPESKKKIQDRDSQVSLTSLLITQHSIKALYVVFLTKCF